jgi:hypothetical protein
MQPLTRRVAGACLLAAPTVLAFFSGGYFPHPRLIAAIAIWLLVLALTVTGAAPGPAGTPGRIAAGGLVALTVWTGLSIVWAPVAGIAVQDLQRLLLYVGVLLLAVGTARDPRVQRAVEPALAAGAAIVIGYGVAGRLLPDAIHLDRSRSAGGRLEQPLTYWNAEGALAAIGLILCARLAGDRSRPRAVRLLAAAAAPLLAAGVYISYSRGAVVVAVLGLLVLAAAAPSRAQVRAAAVVLAAGVLVAVGAELLPGVSSLSGDHRARDGTMMLAVLAAAAAVTALAAVRPDREPAVVPRWYSRLGVAAMTAAAAVAIGLIVGGFAERPSERELAAGAGATRLTSVASNRYEYWRVALDEFGHAPLVGAGAGGFRVAWLQQRPIREAVRDTHSLELEVAAELGLVGLLALALMLGGAAVAAWRALSGQRALAAGAVAALVAWVLHASIDWDWEMPAVTLPALILAGLLIALSDPAGPAAGSPRRPAAAAPDRDPG